MNNSEPIIWAAVGGFVMAIVNMAGRASYTRLFGTRYVTEKECRETQAHCLRHRDNQIAELTSELRAIRKALVKLCEKNHISLDDFQDIIR